MPRRPLDGPRRITGDTASHATYGVGPATDYGADMGEGVYAPISGWVTHWWSDTGGWTVAVTSDDWKVTMQHHSGYRGPTSGWVKEGTLIAVVGSTGSATTGPHTHMWIERAKRVRTVPHSRVGCATSWGGKHCPQWRSCPRPVLLLACRKPRHHNSCNTDRNRGRHAPVRPNSK